MKWTWIEIIEKWKDWITGFKLKVELQLSWMIVDRIVRIWLNKVNWMILVYQVMESIKMK